MQLPCLIKCTIKNGKRRFTNILIILNSLIIINSTSYILTTYAIRYFFINAKEYVKVNKKRISKQNNSKQKTKRHLSTEVHATSVLNKMHYKEWKT